MSKLLEFKTYPKGKPFFVKKDAIYSVYLTDYHDYENRRRAAPARSVRNALALDGGPTVYPDVVCISYSNTSQFIKGTLSNFWKIYNESNSTKSKKSKNSQAAKRSKSSAKKIQTARSN